MSLSPGKRLGPYEIQAAAGRQPSWRIVPVGYFRGNFAAVSTYDISPDGKRFLMIKRMETTPESKPVTLVVVQDWT